jgi:superfamily II DNA/RNA helicase
VIGEDRSKALHKQLQRDKLPVYSLWEQPFVETNSILQLFTNRQANQFPIFIMSDSQGRGLDFSSSSEIEANGGVYLILAKLPPTFLQYRQYLGRTGRIQNKGQYSVILHDGDAKNVDGAIYV